MNEDVVRTKKNLSIQFTAVTERLGGLHSHRRRIQDHAELGTLGDHAADHGVRGRLLERIRLPDRNTEFLEEALEAEG